MKYLLPGNSMAAMRSHTPPLDLHVADKGEDCRLGKLPKGNKQRTDGSTVLRNLATMAKRLASLFHVLVLFGCTGLVWAAEIPVEIRNPAGVPVRQWPVTTGVPFPQGALKSAEQVRLLGEAGVEIPAQVQQTGRHQDGSVRWLLLDFQTDVPAEGRKLTLEFGKDIKRAVVSKPLTVKERGDAIEVDTGALRFVVSKKRFNGLAEAWVGGKLAVSAGSDGGPYFRDDQGREFRAALDPAPEVTVESSGPLRTVVTARGWYQNAAGEKKCRYIVRFYAFAGKPYLRVFYTWLMTEDSRKLRFRDLGFRVPMKVNRCTFGLAGEEQRSFNVSAQQSPCLLQYDCDKFRLFPNTADATTGKAQGFVAAEGAEARCSLAVKDFWQLFPKELGADPGGLTFHTWPAHGVTDPNRKLEDANLQYLWFCHEGQVLDFQAPEAYYKYTGSYSANDYRYLRSSANANALGLAKTHELLLTFAAAGDARTKNAPPAAFQQPPVCMASPEWMSASSVFGALQPVKEGQFPEYEKLISGNFDAESRMQEFTRDYGMWNFGDGHTSWDVGKRRWSDVYRTWRNTHHGSCRVPWLLYFRSGDPKYFAAGVRNARHVLDEDFCHWTTPEFEALDYPQGKGKGALNDYKGIVHWHSGNRLTDYNSMTDFALWYYHMTGDRWGLEVAMDWAEAVKQRSGGPSGSRSGAGTMDALIEVYKETWDPEYRRLIDAFFEHMTTKVQNVDGTRVYSDHVLAYWPRFKDKPTPLGSFPEWENYAPWLEHYCELTGDARAKKALVAWADSYLEGYGDMCSLWNIGDYINILGYAYLYTGDAKYLGRGVWEANRATKSAYSGEDKLLEGLMMAGQTSLAGYLIQRLPVFMKALAIHGKPVTPDPFFTAGAGFQLLLERTRPIVDGKPSKVETVEAWVLEEQDQEFTVTFHTAHSYDQRTYTLRTVSPASKEIVKRDETYPKGSKDLAVTVPKDGEVGVYLVSVAAIGSYGQVSHPVEVTPPMPVAFPTASRILNPSGAEYYVFVPKGMTRFSLKFVTVNPGGVSGRATSPDGKTKIAFDVAGQGSAAAEAVVETKPDQTGALWKLNLAGDPAVLTLASEGASLPPLLFQSPCTSKQCEALAAARLAVKVK